MNNQVSNPAEAKAVDPLAELAHLTPEQRALLALRLRKKAAQQEQPAARSTIQVVPRDGHLPLSFAQQRLWFLDQWEPGSSLYNIPTVLEFNGPLSVAALERGLQTIVERHEVLRATFVADGGTPRQIISPVLPQPLRLIDLADQPVEQRDAAAEKATLAEYRKPFDLQRGPLWRAALLRLAEEQHRLVLVLHHIVGDGWSINVLLRELIALYSAYSQPAAAPASLGPAGTPLPIQYPDFAVWQRDQLQGAALQKQLTYWKQQLADAPAVIELPTDHPRPPIQTFRGRTQTLMLAPTLTEGLKQLSQQANVTLFMTLLGVFKILLYRYTGQADVVVGTTIANRTQVEVEPLIGCFMNTLVLWTRLAGQPTFLELAQRVRETALGAYTHQDLPFEKLVEELQPDRDLSHTPLFQVLFEFHNTPAESLSFPGLTVHKLALRHGTAKYSLSMSVEEVGERLKINLTYNIDLFEPDTIERLLGHFEVLLAGVVADPTQPITLLPLLSAAERQALLVARNATATDYPRAATFPQLFAAQVARTPQAIAVQLGSSTLTYHDLAARANQLAQHLQHLGVGPDTRVALCLERSLELVVALLAIWQAGGAFVPLDPAFPTERMAYILDDAQVAVVLTQAALRPSLPARDLPVLALDTAAEVLASYPTTPPPSQLTADHLAYLIYTSGSTGRPKGVLIPQRGLINYLVWCVAAYGAASGRGAPVHASIAADAIFPSLFAPLLVGTTVVLLPQAQPLEALAEAMTSTGHFSLIKITPSQLEVLQHQLPATDGQHWVETLVIGAEEVRGEILPFWRAHAPATRLLNEYGPTETVVGCSIYAIPPELPPQGSVPIGLPIANTQFYVLDRQMQPVPIGVAGELFIGGDGVAWGYYQRPELTAEQFVPDPFSPTPGARLYKTGDVVKLLADAAANIVFLGRNDDQVKIRGYRVELGEVEGVLRQHPAVEQVVVLARSMPDTKHKQLVAYVVLEDGSSETGATLREFMRAQLPEYMVPSVIMVLDALPLAPHGKLDRAALPDPEHERDDEADEYVAPRTPLEAVLASIWSNILGLDEVGVYDNFFVLGGHSLLAIQMIAQVNKTFQVELTLRSMFEATTVADQAQAIIAKEARPGQSEKIAQILQKIGGMSAEDVQKSLQPKGKRS